jgi:hypothetical protein
MRSYSPIKRRQRGVRCQSGKRLNPKEFKMGFVVFWQWDYFTA